MIITRCVHAKSAIDKGSPGRTKYCFRVTAQHPFELTLPLPFGERVGVRGWHIIARRTLTPALSRAAGEGESHFQN